MAETSTTVNSGEDVEKREPSYTVDGNANWYSHYGEQCGDSLKNLEKKLPYDPAIPLLGIYTEETRIERDTCAPTFTEALFTIARTWKQPRCPLADEWIRKLWYRRHQDGGGGGGHGVHLSPRMHQEYTSRHRNECITPAESRQEYLTSRKEYIEPRKTR